MTEQAKFPCLIPLTHKLSGQIGWVSVAYPLSMGWSHNTRGLLSRLDVTTHVVSHQFSVGCFLSGDCCVWLNAKCLNAVVSIE